MQMGFPANIASCKKGIHCFSVSDTLISYIYIKYKTALTYNTHTHTHMTYCDLHQGEEQFGKHKAAQKLLNHRVIDLYLCHC